MLIHEGNKIILKLVAIGRQNGVAKNLKGPWQSTEVPATKGDDLLNTRHALENLKLLADLFVADVDLKVAWCDISKGEVDVCVYACVNLVNIHGQALAVIIPSLKVCNFNLVRRGRPFDDVYHSC